MEGRLQFTLPIVSSNTTVDILSGQADVEEVFFSMCPQSSRTHREETSPTAFSPLKMSTALYHGSTARKLTIYYNLCIYKTVLCTPKLVPLYVIMTTQRNNIKLSIRSLK